MHLHVISRKDAKSKGLKHYFTGNPCSRGFYALRAIGNKTCMCDACTDAKRNSGARTYAKNRDRYLIGMKEWQSRNKENISKKAKVYRQDNAGRLSKWFRAYGQINKERISIRSRAYNKKFPEKKLANGAQYRARKQQCIASWFSELDDFIIKEAYKLARARRKLTGVPWCVDHAIPIAARSACGLHCFQNIQVIPQEINLMKKNKMIFTEFGEWIGFYEESK